MKAAIWTAYGPPEVIKISHIPKPIPKDDEVLIRIKAATVTAGDCELRRFEIAGWIWLFVRLYMGIFKPRVPILGQELAGQIIETGKHVEQFRVGDKVFCSPGMKMGGYAEYICLKANRPIMLIPRNLTCDEAATIPTGGINGLHFVRKANIKKGDHVLINGAGGSIGTYALQLAKNRGAIVTCVDHGDKLNMLEQLGADHTIDYSKEDFTSNKYDVIIDIVGIKSYQRVINALNKNGRLVLGNPRLPGMLKALWTSMTSSKNVVVALAAENVPDFLYLKEQFEEGKLKCATDRYFALDEIVQAHHYVEKGLKKGNVIVKID